MATNTAEQLHDLMRDFNAAMLVTRTSDGCLRSRPMALADVDDDGTLWFITERTSGKIDEIEHDPQVNVAMQANWKFVSVSGQASIVDDRAKIAELWNEAWKVWFPGGKDDPRLVLLRVHGTEGEYWNNSGTSGIRYLLEAGKAYLTGKQPDVADDPKIHGKVTM